MPNDKYTYSAATDRLAKIIERSISKKNYELALQAVSAYSNLEYKQNRNLVNTFLEKSVEAISKGLLGTVEIKNCDDNVILFYDAFALDTRGLALIYVKALCNKGYRVVYIAKKSSQERQPVFEKLVGKQLFKAEFYDDTFSRSEKAKMIISCFRKYHPANAFMYAIPQDSAAIAAFFAIKNCNKLQINLTDHAFWLGVGAIDYCIEFRSYGYYLSKQYRGIPEDKLRILPFYPIVDEDIPFRGFDFIPEERRNNRIIFSGGALYKTFSDDNKYYEIVSRLLQENLDVIFIYAGSGDDSHIKELEEQFPNRVFHIQERKDLYQVLLHSYVYLNTYPLLGGLMTQYAAIANKIPLTLKCGDVGSGFLINEDRQNFFFDTADELISYANQLFADPDFYKKESQALSELVIHESDFENELECLLKNYWTKYEFVDRPYVVFKQSDFNGFDDEKDIISAVTSKGNQKLFRYFPEAYIKRFIASYFKK